MQCNIDQRGRTARIVTGAIVDIVGTLLILTGTQRNENSFHRGRRGSLADRRVHDFRGPQRLVRPARDGVEERGI